MRDADRGCGGGERNPSLSTVGVASVRDFDDGHGDHLVVDAVDDAILPTANAVKTRHLPEQRLADPLGVLGERPIDELKNRGGDNFGQSIEVASR